MPLEPIYKLRDWIPLKKLTWENLGTNTHPGVFPLLESIVKKKKRQFLRSAMYTYKMAISRNTNAIDYLSNHMDEIDWRELTLNPNAIPLIEKNLDRIDWEWLSSNPNAIPILEKNQDKIKNGLLSMNPNAIPLLEQNPEKIDWYMLSRNPKAVHILKQNLDKVNWQQLCCNRSREAMQLLEEHIDEQFVFDELDFQALNANKYAVPILEKYPSFIDITYICYNEAAMHIVERNLHDYEINWYGLSRNPSALPLLERYPENIIWYNLCNHSWAIDLIEKNQDRIYWPALSNNPAIFVYDYTAMRESYKVLKEEIIKAAWHPKRVTKWLEHGMDLDDL